MINEEQLPKLPADEAAAQRGLGEGKMEIAGPKVLPTLPSLDVTRPAASLVQSILFHPGKCS